MIYDAILIVTCVFVVFYSYFRSKHLQEQAYKKGFHDGARYGYRLTKYKGEDEK